MELNELGFSVGYINALPGQEDRRLGKKAVVPLFPDAGFRHLRQVIPFRSGSLCGEEEGMKWGRFDPGPYYLRRLPFCPGNIQASRNHQLN